MDSFPPELKNALMTNHPARPYLIGGSVLGLYGLLKGGIGGLILLGAGGALLKAGADEMRRIEALHGGNAHGVNGPPEHTLG